MAGISVKATVHYPGRYSFTWHKQLRLRVPKEPVSKVRGPLKTVFRSGRGGNLQKIILAREISRDVKLLIASQPTRGLDVGAIEYVQTTLLEQKRQGKAILLISENLDETLHLSDRIAVIYEGKIVGIVSSKEADRREIGLMMAGGHNN